jgi:predicted acetyltransferase
MMRRQLENIRAAGEPVAALWASEGGIYGRFGFGVATQIAELRARRPAARLAVAPPAGAPLRAGIAAEHVEAMRAIHARVVPARPGMLDRPGPWWDERLYETESDREGSHALRAVVRDGEAYALYAVRRKWEEDGPAGDVVVRELVAATHEGHAAIWAYLLDLDLTATVSWELAPSDEPLWLALTDPRAVRRLVGDALWVRIVDVPAALGARTYAAEPDVVLEVRDGFCPWNEGRYRLRADGCEPTADEPDLVLDAAALGAAYLGGTLLRDLAAAGRVEERTPGSLARASAAFRGDVAPWCPEIF